MGRPSKIKACLEKIDLDKVQFLTEQGYTDDQLADLFSVNQQTINDWKKDYPAFYESLKKGKLIADAKVEASLYQRACGYTHPEVDIKLSYGKIIKTQTLKHYAPDVMACMYWLNNRRRMDWATRQGVEVSGQLSHNNFYQDIIAKKQKLKAKNKK